MTVLELKESRVNISDDANGLVHELAERICVLAKEAINARNQFTIALSGGTTPKALYELLATPEYSGRINWEKVLVFLGDERCVPHNHPDSNFGMAKAAWLSKVNIPPSNVFATEGQDKDPEQAAKHYEESIRRAFGVHSDFPVFDLVLLGLGPDGHTASLFPDSAALGQKQRIFVANFSPKMQAWRMTLTFPAINHARNIAFLVSGSSKAAIIDDIFHSQTKKYPAQFVQPDNGKLEWYMDRAAAASLSGG
ncbi:MAG TPA: 6-phosphogluconolactonase [Planktothrix sp.]|jgi:6-phosphogluconolactonase